MSDKLKPCPLCKTECRVKIGNDPFIKCIDDSCPYMLRVTMETEALTIHNSIPRGETCKRKPHGHLFRRSCDGILTGYYKGERYCSQCRMKIEEVSE